MTELWKAMDAGTRFGLRRLLRFNGHFFADAEALPLTPGDLVVLADFALRVAPEAAFAVVVPRHQRSLVEVRENMALPAGNADQGISFPGDRDDEVGTPDEAIFTDVVVVDAQPHFLGEGARRGDPHEFAPHRRRQPAANPRPGGMQALGDRSWLQAQYPGDFRLAVLQEVEEDGDVPLAVRERGDGGCDQGLIVDPAGVGP